VYCHHTGGYCAIANQSSGLNVTVIYSTDNGASWTIGTPYTHGTTDQRTFGPIINNGGSIGIITRGINSPGGQPFGTKSGSDFTNTPNYVPVPATGRNCRPYIMDNTTRALCTPNAGGNSFQVVDGTLPVEVGAAFTLTDAFTASVNETLVVGFNTNFGYIVMPSATSTTRLNLYISTGQFAGGASLVGNMTTSTILIAGCCKGNILEWGGKIYFTSGAPASNAFFGVIQ
jgi:hypothetical protein